MITVAKTDREITRIRFNELEVLKKMNYFEIIKLFQKNNYHVELCPL
jgi:hypothetical protein